MSEEPSDADDAPDNVIVVSFGEPRPETRIADREHCRHRNFELDTTARTTRCGLCGAQLDAFAVLLEYAHKERNWRMWNAEHKKLSAKIEALKEEEQRIKARTRNASKRDADLAVAQARERLAEKHRRIQWNANQIAELAGRIARAMQEPESTTRKRGP